MCTKINKLAHESQSLATITWCGIACLLFWATIEMAAVLCLTEQDSLTDGRQQGYPAHGDNRKLAMNSESYIVKTTSDGEHIKRLLVRVDIDKGIVGGSKNLQNNTRQTEAKSGSKPMLPSENNDENKANISMESSNSDDLRRISTLNDQNEQSNGHQTTPLQRPSDLVGQNDSSNLDTALIRLQGPPESSVVVLENPANVTESHRPFVVSTRKRSRSIFMTNVDDDISRARDVGYSMVGHDSIGAAESEQKFDEDSNCALILKRTYIIGGGDQGEHESRNTGDEWGEKFVFNDADPDDEADRRRREKSKRIKGDNGRPKRKMIHKTDLCITHSDVDKAIEQAKHQLKFEPPKDLNSLEISDASVASVGELSLVTSSLLVKQFDLSHDEILNALPMIDMSATKFFWKDLCPKHVQAIICAKSRYRTITGHCNNLRHPSWGAAKTPYSRYLPPDYGDGVGAPRVSRVDGKPLPSARLISSIVHADSDEPSNDHSILFADWGQLLNHDVTRVAVGKATTTPKAPDCCPHHLKGLCMPIQVPASDPLYSKFKVKCLKFDRSLPAIRPKCLLGPRSPFNLITAAVDASFVYGSSRMEATALRTFSGGKLRVWNYFQGKLKPLLPPKTQQPDDECLGRPKDLFCFMAGDVRVNEQTHLTVLHTVYVREHNRLAKSLGQLNLDWDDDKIYHETRHIVAACVQHIMTNEFLPQLLGPQLMAEHQLSPASGSRGGGSSASVAKLPDHWNGYDPSVTVSTGAAFAAAAFRYGHSQIEGLIRRMDPKSGSLVSKQLLRFLLKRPFILYEPGAIDQLIMGMLLTPAEQTDPFVSEELSGHLFQPPKAKFGHDLAAINIQRGRDKGVPGYNDWREWCGLTRAKSFEDLKPLLMNRTAWQFEQIYKHVDDIDLWSAGISERKLPGSAVGPTLACIIARQFLNFKRGDRFWYENPSQPSSFTTEQLREIKKVKLAKILCTNSDDITMIQPWAMRLPHPIYNARVPCESLPNINLKYWDISNLESGYD